MPSPDARRPLVSSEFPWPYDRESLTAFISHSLRRVAITVGAFSPPRRVFDNRGLFIWVRNPRVIPLCGTRISRGYDLPSCDACVQFSCWPSWPRPRETNTSTCDVSDQGGGTDKNSSCIW